MKKVLALFLAVLMVTSCMMLTAFAAEESATYTGTKFVAVSDCDTVEGWVDDRGMALSTELKTQGTGSITSTMTGMSNEVSKLGFEFFAPVAMDISAMKTLVFDLYISDVDAIDGVWWEFELRGVGGGDANEAAARTTLQAICGQDLQDGWNRVTLPLSALLVTGTVDWTNWHQFRMYSNEGSGVTYGCAGDTVMAIDNMYFTAENIDNHHIIHLNAPSVNVAHNGATEAKAGLHIKDKIPDWDYLHHWDYSYIEFDIEIDNAAANDYPYTFAIGSQIDYAQPAYTYTFTPSEAVGEDLVPGVRYHVAIPSVEWTRTTYSYDVNNLRTFQIYNAGNGSTGADATVAFSGFFFSNGPEDDYNGANLLADFAGNGMFYTAGAGSLAVTKWSDLFKGVGTNYNGLYGSIFRGFLQLASVAGAGSLAADNYFRTFVQGMSVTIGNPNTYNYPEWFSNAKVTEIQMDVYAKADGLQKNGVDITAGDLYLGVALATATTDTWSVGATAAVQLKSGEALGDGWYRVTIPVEDFGGANLATMYAMSFNGNVEGNYGVTYTGNFNLYVDNICAVLGEVEVDDYNGASLLTDFVSEGEFFTTGNGATKIETWSGQFKGAGTYAGTGSWSNGALQLANVAGAGTLDASNYFRTVISGMTNAIGTYTYSDWLADAVAIQLDVYAAADGLQKDGVDITAGDLYIGMAMATGMTDSWSFGSIASAQLKSGEDLGNGWYRVQLPLSAMGNVNIAQLYALRFDSNVAGNTGVTYTGNFVVKVDNICAVVKDENEVIMLNWDSSGSALNRSNCWLDSYVAVDGVIADVDGVSDLELKVFGATGAGTSVINDCDTVSYSTTPDFSNGIDAISIDMRVTANGTITKGDATIAPEDYGVTIFFRDNNDHGGNTYSITVRPSMGTAIGGGWYRITVPYADVVVSGTAFDWVDLATIHFDNRTAEASTEGAAFSDGLEVAFDNLTFMLTPASVEEPDTPDTPEVPEEPEEITCVDIHGANLVLNQNFKMNFNADLSGVVDAYMTIAFNGNTVMNAGTAGATDENGITRYVYGYDGIYAHQMAKPITAKLWALGEDGLLITDVKADYSVKENLVNLIASGDAATATLATDALVYGAAAQTYANIILPELITEGVDLSNASTAAFGATQLATVVNGEYTAQAAQWTGATLVLDNTINVRFYLKAADVSALSVTVSGVAAAGTVTEFVEHTDGVYYFDVPVLATEYDSTIKVVADDASYFVNYSVNNYLAKYYTAEPAEDAVNFNNLLLAIYRYGASASAY